MGHGTDMGQTRDRHGTAKMGRQFREFKNYLDQGLVAFIFGSGTIF